MPAPGPVLDPVVVPRHSPLPSFRKTTPYKPEYRVSSPDEDTQPLQKPIAEILAEAEPADLGPETQPQPAHDLEPEPPPRSLGPRSLRPLPEEIEGRISREIPPPDHVEFEGGRPVDGKDPYLGTTFDKRYKIEQIIGEGGMGFVYLARHKVIDKKVAVKVLRADMARDRENLDRFLQEARAASSIGNPHIVDISDFGDLPDGSTYFVMEYLDGGSLSRLIDAEKKKLPVERICHIAIQLTNGLAAAHKGGIVHRDLKPDNVILISRAGDNEFVKILDFGIAKVMSTAEKLTVAGAVFGTPHYMSPEQAAGTPVDHRTDVYSLGIMLYEMASGQLPFNADNFMAILSQHMYQAPTPIREIASECSPGLEAVILKCLSKKPEARYQTMDELKADLEKVKAGEIPSAVSEMMTRSEGFDVPPEYFKPRGTSASHVPAAQRRPWGLYAAAVLALLAGVGATIFAYFALKQPVSVDKPTTGTALAQTAPPPPPSDVAPAPVPPPSAEAQVKPAETQEPATITAQEPKKISVGIAAMPDSAMAYRDGKALKLPSTIEVEEGKSVTVEVRADGYETAVVSLDGKEAIKMVKLNKLAVGSGTAKPSTPPGGKAGSSEIVDPYGSKYQQKKVSPKK